MPLGIVVVLAFMLVVMPVAGAVASLATFVAVAPLGSSLSDRLVLAFCLLCGLFSVYIPLGHFLGVALNFDSTRVLAAVPGISAAVLLALYPDWRPRLPHPDAALVPLVGTAMGSWLLMGPAMLGRSPQSVMGGLAVLNWDHQSHFSIFASVYRLGGVWNPGEGIPQPLFDGYPPLQGFLQSWGLWLVHGQRTPMDTELLVVPYAHATALVTAVALGMLAWAGGRVAGIVLARKEGGGAAFVPAGLVALGGVAVGGYLCLGHGLNFFDLGFSNFLLAVALAVVASLGAIASLGRSPHLAALVLAATVASIGLLWTPVLFVLIPAGAVVGWRMLRAGDWRRIVVAVGAAVSALAVVAWQVLRLTPDPEAATGLATAIASAGGGHTRVPIAPAIALVFAAFVLRTASGDRQRDGWSAALAPCAAALVLFAAFVTLTARAGTAMLDSYYVAKVGAVVFLVAIPLLGGLVALATEALASYARRPHLSVRAARALIGGAFVVLLWSTPGSDPEGATGYFALPHALEQLGNRWAAFRRVEQGHLVYGASEAIGPDRDALPVLWDEGNLLLNRWLASLRDQLTGPADAFYTSLGHRPAGSGSPSITTPQYGSQAVDALRVQLASHPSLSVAIAYRREATAHRLRPLIQDFPDRVRLHRIE